MTFVVTVTSVFVRTIIHQIAFFGRGNLENNIYSYIFSLFFTFILNYIFLEHLFLLLTAGGSSARNNILQKIFVKCQGIAYNNQHSRCVSFEFLIPAILCVLFVHCVHYKPIF